MAVVQSRQWFNRDPSPLEAIYCHTHECTRMFIDVVLNVTK